MKFFARARSVPPDPLLHLTCLRCGVWEDLSLSIFQIHEKAPSFDFYFKPWYIYVMIENWD